MMYSIYVPMGDHEGLIPKDLLTRCGLHALEDDCGPDVSWISKEDWAAVRRTNPKAKVPEGDGKGRLLTWFRGKPELDAPRQGTEEFAQLEWYKSPASTHGGWPMFSPQDKVVYERGAYWVGIHTQKKPTPTDCPRRKQYPGYAVTLGDGHQWVIPGAWIAPASCGVDMETGYAEEVIDEKWKSYCRTAAGHAEEFYRLTEVQVATMKLYYGVKLTMEETQKLMEFTKDGERPDTSSDLDKEKMRQIVQFNDVVEQAWIGLGINYRIHPVIATLLNLLPSMDHVMACCTAAFDRQRVSEALKKNGAVREVTIPFGLIMYDGDEPLNFAL